MAHLLKADGTIKKLTDKQISSLEKKQKLVGGYIQTVPIYNGDVIICNEEGKLRGLPLNSNATLLYAVGKGKIGNGGIHLSDVMCGDVIVATKKEATFDTKGE